MFDAALRHDIQARAVDLIRAHLPSLKRQGRSWVGLCPFHDDSTPSFVLSPENGLFYCHACQAGGDVLTFLMRLKRLTFPEALTEAARSLGLPLPQRNSENTRTAALAETAETAATLFTHWLWSDAGKPGRTYLKKRGLTEETVRAFRVGFHPDHPTLLLTALTQRDINPETARHLGLLARKHERWIGLMRGRLVFPICDRQGTVRGFGARKLCGPGPKYLNSPESGLFHKGRLLYGLPQAASAIQEHHTAVVVEGYVDVLTLHQAGFRYVVSPMATALTPDHLAVVRQLTERVTLLFDGDAAGQRAPLSAMSPAADTGLIAHVVRLPEGEDPDSYLGRYGPAALHELMAAAVPLTIYILDTLLARGDPAQAARDAVALASQVHEPTCKLVFLQAAEQQFRLPAGSLTEAAGIGAPARRHLEELLCGLLLTVPEVRARLRSCSLPVADPQVRAIAESALQGKPRTGHLYREAGRLAQLVGGFGRRLLRLPAGPTSEQK